MRSLFIGEIRSCFVMIEFVVVSLDVMNIESVIVCEGLDYVLNGCKWWILGVCDLRCKVIIFMGKIVKDGSGVAKYR